MKKYSLNKVEEAISSIKKGEIKKICFLTPNSFRANLACLYL